MRSAPKNIENNKTRGYERIVNLSESCESNSSKITSHSESSTGGQDLTRQNSYDNQLEFHVIQSGDELSGGSVNISIYPNVNNLDSDKIDNKLDNKIDAKSNTKLDTNQLPYNATNIVSSPVYKIPPNGLIREFSDLDLGSSPRQFYSSSLSQMKITSSSILPNYPRETKQYDQNHNNQSQNNRGSYNNQGHNNSLFKPSSFPNYTGKYPLERSFEYKSNEVDRHSTTNKRNSATDQFTPYSSRSSSSNSFPNSPSVLAVSPPRREFNAELFLSSDHFQIAPRIGLKYLVLEGGGVKGIALIGGLSELYSSGEINSLKHIAGSSVGALIGSLVACKIPFTQLNKYIFDMDFTKFRDSSWNLLKNMYRIQYKCGWYHGNELYEEHGRLLASVPKNSAQNPADITFQEIYSIYGTNLVIPVTLVYKQGCISINLSRQNFPNMPVRLATRYSASFPLWFEALPFLGTLTTDGGLLNNYPVDVFAEYPDFYTHGIGLKLVSNHEIRAMASKIGDSLPSKHLNGCGDILGGAPANMEEFTYSIVGAVYDNAQLMHIPPHASGITVSIDTGHISSMNFNISKTDKTILFESGKNAVSLFLQKRENEMQKND